MSLNVVYDCPTTNRLRRFGESLTRFAGVILLLGGVVATILVLLFLVHASFGKSTFDASRFLPALKYAVPAALCFAVGARLLRGQRRMALFLRRFGFVGPTKTLTYSLATGMGRSWRLVTLDDDKVAPVGPGKASRWAFTAYVVAAVICILALGWAFEPVLKWLADWLYREPFWITNPESPRDFKTEAEINFAVQLALGIWDLAEVAAQVIFLVASALICLGASYWIVRRVERAKRRLIETDSDIAPILRSVVDRSHRLLSAKLVVVRVAPAIWQQTVRFLGEHCSAVIVDISEPTANLVWEVRELRHTHATRCIFIGDRERLSRIGTAAFGDSESPEWQLYELVEGTKVLGYSGDKVSRKRFARALRGTLDELLRPPLQPVP